MKDDYSNLSNEDFNRKYIDLINKGYNDNSPEMVELFKARAGVSSNLSNRQSSIRQKAQDNSNKTYSYAQHRVRSGATNKNSKTYSKPYSQTNFSQSKSKTYNRADSKSYLSHIIIDPDSGDYTLLDSNLNIIDYIHKNPIFSFITQHHKLKQFKKQLKKDFKLYKKSCKAHNKKPNRDFKSMFSSTKYYLKLCPDADYQILELLRNNITKINPNYSNYQTACAEYLYELAQLRDGDSSKMPFDINFCCDKIDNDHVYISNRFDPAPDPVQKFRSLYSKEHNLESKFQSDIRYEAKVPNTKFAKVRSIHIPTTHDRG